MPREKPYYDRICNNPGWCFHCTLHDCYRNANAPMTRWERDKAENIAGILPDGRRKKKTAR